MSEQRIHTKVTADASQHKKELEGAGNDLKGFKAEAEKSGGSLRDLARTAEREMRTVGESVGRIATGIGDQSAAWASLGSSAVRAMTSVAGALGPVGIGIAAVGLILHKVEAETVAFEKAMISTGQSGELTANMLHESARRSAEAIDATRGALAEALTMSVSTGRIAAENLQRVSEASVQWARVSGQSVQQVVTAFAELGRSPVEASEKLNEQHQYLTAEIYGQIRALRDQGREAEAAALAQGAYADMIEGRAPEMQRALGTIESAWKGVKEWASEAWDAMLGIGREATLEERLAEARRLLENGTLARRARAAQLGGGPAIDPAAVVRQLEEELATEQRISEEKRKQSALDAAGIEWIQLAEKYLTREEKLRRELVKIETQGLAAGKSRAEIDALQAKARERYTKATKEGSAADKEAARAIEAQRKERERDIAAARKGLETAESQVQKQREQNEEIGLTEEALADLTAARHRQTAAQFEERAATIALFDPQSDLVQIYRAQAAAQLELATLLQQGAARRAGLESAEGVAEAWGDAWEDIGSTITDELVRAFRTGENVWEATLDTMVAAAATTVLRPIVDYGVQSSLGFLGYGPGAGMPGVAGSAAGGGGFGMNPLSLLNIGNSVAALSIGGQVLGGSMSLLNAGATIGANAAGTGLSGLIAGTGGWGTAGAGTATAMGSIGSFIGAAMPIIGIGLALASMFGGSGERFERQVSSGTGRMEDGRWENLGPDPDWFPNEDQFGVGMDRGAVQLQKAFSNRLDALFEAFDVDATIDTGVRTRLRRTSGSLIAEFFGAIDGEEFTTGGDGERLQYGEDGEIQDAWEQFINDAMTKGIAAAIQVSPLPENIRDIFAEELNNDEIDAALDTLIGVGTLRGKLDGMPEMFQRLSSSIDEVLSVDNYDDLTDAAMELGELQSAMQVMYGLTTTGAEKFADAQRAVAWEFDQLGIAMPRSTDEFRRLADGIDLTTEEGRKLYKELAEIAPAFYDIAVAVEAVFDAISISTANTIDQFTLDTLDDRGKYSFYDDRIDSTIDELATAFDPAEIARLYEEANRDLIAAWNLLSAEEQRRLLSEFIDRQLEIEALAQQQLSVTPVDYGPVIDAEAEAIGVAVEGAVERAMTTAADKIAAAADTQADASDGLIAAVGRIPREFGVLVTVRGGDADAEVSVYGA